jgi:hypothetical protein
MKFNKWTVGLAAIGVVSLASAARADEKMSQVQTALSNTTLSGYVDVAATYRPGTDSGPLGANLPAYAFSKNDGFSLNAVDLALDKPMDESPWASGYHVELMFGPDATPASIGPNNTIANLRQAYVTLRTPVGNGIDWKVGVFDTIIGYESTSDPLNPNYTRSYGYTIEPKTHTGVLATYKVTDVLAISAGVANSSNVGTGTPAVNGTSTYESQKTYMGSIALTAPDSFGALKGATLDLGIINSVDSAVSGAGTRTSYYAGVTLPTPSSALKLGAAFDYLTFNNRGGGNTDDSIWVAGLYATLQPSDKLSFNLRGEIVDATQIGSSITSPSPFGSQLLAPSAYSGHYAGEVTATAQYQLWVNVLSRLEFRWDHVYGDAFGYSQGAATGGNPIKKNDFLIALNLIYQF